MTLYKSIFDFIHDYFFVQTGFGTAVSLERVTFDIGGLNMRMDIWLSHTCTLVIMIIALILACLLVRWVWRVVSSAFLLK